MKPFDLIEGLPGETLIREGFADVMEGRRTPAACLISIARPRLQEAGLIPSEALELPDAELTLYRLLGQEPGDAYSRYNALLRELVSFENALDHRLTKRRASDLTLT